MLVDLRVPTWQAIGKDVSSCNTITEVLETSKLDFDVEKEPLYVHKSLEDEQFPLKGLRATVQKGTQNYFGVVNEHYEVCNNSKAFEFIDYVSDELKFLKAGMTHFGKSYVIAALPKIEILGDSFTPNLIFQNGFNGKIALKAAIVPLRIICQNQFNIAFKEADNAISIKHTKNLNEELVQARQMLKNTNEYLNVLRKKAEYYAGIKVDNLNLEKVFDFLFPTSDDLTGVQLAHLEAKRNEFVNAYNVDDNRNFRGTAWGIINAMSDYMTHYTPKKTKNSDENKFEKVTFSPFLNRLSEYLVAIGG